VISTGLRGFAKNNRNNDQAKVKYRICQEGVQFLIPHMTKRKFTVNEVDFRTALATPGKNMHLSIFSNHLADQIRPLTAGAFVLVHEINTIPEVQQQNDNNLQDCVVDHSDGAMKQQQQPKNDKTTPTIITLAAVMWKCRGDSIDTLVAKIEIDGILTMLNAMKTNQNGCR
jgi:hypothetical protein